MSIDFSEKCAFTTQRVWFSEKPNNISLLIMYCLSLIAVQNVNTLLNGCSDIMLYLIHFPNPAISYPTTAQFTLKYQYIFQPKNVKQEILPQALAFILGANIWFQLSRREQKLFLLCGLEEYTLHLPYLLEFMQLKSNSGILMSQRENTELLRDSGISWKLSFQMPYAFTSNSGRA